MKSPTEENDIIITNNIPIVDGSTTYHNYVGHIEEKKRQAHQP